MKRLLALAAMAPLMAFPVLAQDDAKMRSAQDGNTQTMSNEISASALLNENVVNANNETIGDVNDVLLGKDGKVASGDRRCRRISRNGREERCPVV